VIALPDYMLGPKYNLRACADDTGYRDESNS